MKTMVFIRYLRLYSTTPPEERNYYTSNDGSGRIVLEKIKKYIKTLTL